MKKTLIIFCIVAFCIASAEGSVIKRRINKDNNPILTNNILFNILKDSVDRIWINTNSHLIRSNSIECNDWTDYSDSIKENLLFQNWSNQFPVPQFRSFNNKIDKHGNMIFHTMGGLGIFYTADSSWDFLTRDNPDLQSYQTIIFNHDIACDNNEDRVYVTGQRDTMFYAQYQAETGRYHYEDWGGEQYLSLPDSSLYVRDIEISGDSIWILTKISMLIYDKKTKEFTTIDKQDSSLDINFFEINSNLSLGTSRLMYHSPNFDRFIFHRLKKTLDSSAWKMLTDDSIWDISIENGEITGFEEIILEKELKYSEKIFFDFVDSDDVKDSLLVGNWSEMWLYNIKSKELSQIPRPDEFGEDTLQEWAAQNILVVPERNELWLGNSNYGILICDLKQILESAEPVGVVDSEIEINTRFPILGCSKIYPQPSSGVSFIELYHLIGSAFEIEVEVYDISGSLVQLPGIEIIPTQGIRRKATIPTSTLSRGIYIVVFKYDGYSCSSKLIIN